MRGNMKDAAGGASVALVGLGTLLAGRDLPVGGLDHLGPGFFPAALGLALVLLGSALLASALRRPAAEGGFRSGPPRAWRMAVPLGAVLLFALVLPGLGLPLTLLLVVSVAAAAGPPRPIRLTALLAAGVALLSTLLFVYALKLPLPVTGAWLRPAASVLTRLVTRAPS